MAMDHDNSVRDATLAIRMEPTETNLRSGVRLKYRRGWIARGLEIGGTIGECSRDIILIKASLCKVKPIRHGLGAIVHGRTGAVQPQVVLHHNDELTEDNIAVYADVG